MIQYIITSTLALGALGITGCSDEVSTTKTDQNELITSAEQGDVRMAVHAASLDAEAGEPIELIVTIEAPPSMRASLELPEEEQLGSFDILRVEEGGSWVALDLLAAKQC